MTFNDDPGLQAREDLAGLGSWSSKLHSQISATFGRNSISAGRLVAAGRTSGEIATELFISARTAEHHIQNIYTKIGVSNRAAATRWAVAHRVVDGVPGG